MPITRTTLKRFTAFEDLDISFSPGINVLVGENGTGKTHLMKVCYAACAFPKTGTHFVDKLRDVFLPGSRDVNALAKQSRNGTEPETSISMFGSWDSHPLNFSLSIRDAGYGITGEREWSEHSYHTAYVPVKDMLANAPGFRSLYALRELYYEEVYVDILNLAYLPALRQSHNSSNANMVSSIQRIIGGEIVIKDEKFFLNSEHVGLLEFPLVAEGLRKLALIWLLIKNGSIREGSVLFWDEPETNLNPKLYQPVIETLLTLQRNGVQIFLATHDYVILKELDLQMTQDDDVAFHSLYRDDETGEISCKTSDRIEQLHPNAILDTFDSLYNRDLERALAGIETTQ